MRAIKFRMWSKKANKYFYDPQNVYDCLKFSKMDETSILYEDMTWQQFTGLKDKNGKEIFEGDVIRGLFNIGPAGEAIHTATVYWNDLNGYQWNYWNLDTIEIIGNIFENNELLK